ncbi:MAG: GIY-YIG nuclease family protein [Verrucomicrobiia bacterium]
MEEATGSSPVSSTILRSKRSESEGCPPQPWRRRTSIISPRFELRLARHFRDEVLMYHVYIVRSRSDSSQHYLGFTEDVKQRLADHNAGHCTHTSKHRPWELVAVVSFADREAALAFERYLKSGSGRAFASRHFRCSSGIVHTKT